MNRVLVQYDDSMLEHDMGAGHPERPERLSAIRDRLRAALGDEIDWAAPAPVAREMLERVHGSGYVDRLERLRGVSSRLDADTSVCPKSVEAAWLAAGAGVAAVEASVTTTARRGLALVRPPGHHAEREHAMGFCLFNNIAVAAAHARAALGCRRVLIVDWDVHHGNGTQHAFYDTDEVLFVSSHQFPFYPGTGRLEETGTGKGEGFTVNLPLPAGQGDDEYVTVFRDVLVPVCDEWHPDLVLVSAGFDAHRADPLANMRVTEAGFAALTALVAEIAEQHAGGRLVLLLEGGYDLEALAGSVEACARVLRGETAPSFDAVDPSKAAMEVVRAVRTRLRERWRSLDS